MKVIIFYEHLVREWKAVQRLKARFEEQGDSVKVFSIIFERTKACRAARGGVDLIFVPWFGGEFHELILSPLLESNPNAKIINLHHEEVGSKSSEAVLFPTSEYCKNGSYHFVWGEYFKTKLIENGVNEDTIFITGNMRNDEASATVQHSKAELAAEFGLDEKKSWILFAENRGWLLQRNSEGAKEELKKRGLTDEDIAQSLEYSQKSLDAFFAEIKRLDRAFGEQFEFIYRPHPGTHFDAQEDFPSCLHVICTHSIYDWIKSSDLFLTCESTSIFEADMCGKPVATFDLVEEPEKMKMAGVHDYPRLSSLLEITPEYIERLRVQTEQNEKIYKRYLGEVDGRATERIVLAANEVAKRVPIDIPYRRATKKENLHQAMFEAATWLTVHLGLLEKLRFPKSAFTEKGDIPYAKANAWIRKKPN